MAFPAIRTFPRLTRQYLQNLNLFQSHLPAKEEHELRNQRIATRFFLVLLVISLLVFLIYTSLGTVVKTVTIQTPNLEQYTQLYAKYANTLTCPCANIAIDYEKFLTIDYKLHQVCSSAFVSDEWFQLFENFKLNTPVLSADFRGIGQFAFQALRSICTLVNETIVDSLKRFNTMVFIRADVVSPIVFHSQINSIVKQYQSTTTTDFLSSLRIIRNTTQANLLFSFLQSNAYLHFQTNSPWSTIYTIQYEDCDCRTTASCIMPLSFYDDSPLKVLFVVPGMYRGCYVFEALLQSDLRCFYNQTCLQQVLFFTHFNTTLNIKIMNQSANSYFSATTPLGQILDELMVDKWQWSAEYDRYFNQCQPTYCSYTYTSKNDMIYIVTTTISLIGGLVTILRLLLLRIVRLIRWKFMQQILFHPNIDIRESRIRRLKEVREKIYRFNLFSSNPPTTDEVTLRYQLRSTYVFISLFISLLIILLIYTSTIQVIKTITVNSPTVLHYIQLYERHAQTLSCPCSDIAIDYKDFFNITYTFHTVCQSDFVTEKWINYLFESAGNRVMNAIDFRATSISTFRALSSMCDLVNDTLAYKLDRFYTTKLLSTEVIVRELFQSQMSSQMDFFQSSTTKEFLSSLKLVEETTQLNALFSAMHTNAQSYLVPNDYIIYMPFRQYGECSCSISRLCSFLSPIVNDEWTEIVFHVPGIYAGCYLIDALLQSNLLCFYNQTCLHILMSYISDTVSLNITSLNTSTNEFFSVDDTIEKILNEMMVDKWQWTADFEKYFNICQPAYCSYTEQTRNDAIYIITTVIGLIGGLVKALRLIVPHSLLLFRKTFQERNRRSSIRCFTLNNIRGQIQTLWRLNLFRSIPAATRQRELHMQTMSTRLFYFLFLSSLTVLLVYTATIPVTRTFSIKSPTLHQYMQFYEQYASTLVCPCNSVAVRHDKYIHIHYSLHPICSSDFIQDKWIKFIEATWMKYPIMLSDIRWQGVFAFQSLGSFCRLLDETIKIGLTRLYADRYISMIVSPSFLFQSKTNAIVSEFQTATIREFLSSLHLVREYTFANALQSTLRSNVWFYYNFEAQAARAINRIYNITCQCGSRSQCIETAHIYKSTNMEVVYTIPGFYIGCYVIDALLQSNLQCFYNQTCVQELVFYIDSNEQVNFTAINTSPTSHFSPKNTVQDILNELMVDHWQWSADYEKYYNACQPIDCSYTYSERCDLIYIVTTLIGLVGGLLTALKLTVPHVVVVLYYFFKPNRQVLPTIFTVTDQTHEKAEELVIEDVN